MKLTKLLFFMTALIVLLTACASVGGEGTTTTTATATTTTMALGMGHPDSDYPDYSRAYYPEFSIGKSLSLLADPNAYETWQNQFESNGGTRWQQEYNVYNLIVELQIPRSAVEELCEKDKRNGRNPEFSEDVIELLYNGTPEEVHAYFAMPHSLVMGTKVFSPRWLVEHTVEEHRAAGITAEIFAENFEKVSGGCYKEEQRQNLREKLGGTYTTTGVPVTTATLYPFTTAFPYTRPTELPPPKGGGCDTSRYVQTFVPAFSMSSGLEKLVDGAAYEAWFNTFKTEEGPGLRVEFNVYTFLKDFNIPRATVEEICRKHEELYGSEFFTREELDVLYNGTENEVYAFFANPAGIVIGKTVYPPKWLAEHSVEEYREAGITAAMIDEKWDAIVAVCTQQNRTAELQAILQKKNQL